MVLRWTVLFIGVVAVVTGVVGILTPVSAGPQNVACGTVVAEDLSAARAATVRGGANLPAPDRVPETPGVAEPDDDIIVNSDYVNLCRKELTDRRMWTVTLAAVGAVGVLAGVLAAAAARRGSAKETNRR